MHTVTREIDATPQQVWRVLADGWTYPSWVVGSSRMRAVGPDWPAAGATLYHSAGAWPAVVNDETTVLASEPGRRLKLQAKGWPAGEATIELLLEPSARGCRVTIVEDVTRGPSLLVPQAVRQPVIALRNTETLRRLAYLAEARTHPEDGAGAPAGSPGSLHRSHIEPGGADTF